MTVGETLNMESRKRAKVETLEDGDNPTSSPDDPAESAEYKLNFSSSSPSNFPSSYTYATHLYTQWRHNISYPSRYVNLSPVPRPFLCVFNG
jgi:hypothetical protein